MNSHKEQDIVVYGETQPIDFKGKIYRLKIEVYKC